MGLLTLVELRTELYASCDNADELDPATATGQARCDRALNWAYQRLQLPNVFNHLEKQSIQSVVLVAGTSSYAFTLYAIDHVQYESLKRRVTPMTRRQLSSTTLPSGPPTKYAQWGTNIYFNYVPTVAEAGNTITLWGWSAPTSLVVGGSILSTVWDEVIVTGGRWRAWRSLGEQVKADTAREEYAALVNDTVDVLKLGAFDQGWQNQVGPSDYLSGSY